MMKSLLCFVMVAMLSMSLMACAPYPRIVLKDTELTYNRKPLKLSAPLEDWIKVIGEQPTQDAQENSDPNLRIDFVDYIDYTWENLGLAARVTINDKHPVEMFQININGNAIMKALKDYFDSIATSKEEKQPVFPPFPGYLKLNGLSISSATTLDEIQKFFAGKDGSLREGVEIDLFCVKSPSDCRYRSGDITTLVGIGFKKTDHRRDYDIDFTFLVDRK